MEALQPYIGNLAKFQDYVDDEDLTWALCSVCCGRMKVGYTRHSPDFCMQNRRPSFKILRISQRYVCPFCFILCDSMPEAFAHLGFHHWRDLALFGISKEHCLGVFSTKYEADIAKAFPGLTMKWSKETP